MDHFSSLVLLTTLSALLFGHPASARDSELVVEGQTTYLSSGKKIKVDTFFPKDADKSPAVLVLYGSGGAFMGYGEMQDFSRLLAQNGMAAFSVHYFKRTGSIYANDRTILKLSEVWLETVKDGVDFVATHPRTKMGAIGMYGYSLGAYMAIGEGCRDVRIKAVAELAGGRFQGDLGKMDRFPPMLILHGREDERVPVDRAEALQRVAHEFHAKPEVKIYEGEGHRLSRKALNDAHRRALVFLKQHLGK